MLRKLGRPKEAVVAVHWKSPKSEQKGNLWNELENYLCCVLYCSKTLGICVLISVKAEPGNPRLPLCTLQKHHCISLAEREKITINFMTDYLSGSTSKNGCLSARSTAFSPDCGLFSSFCIIPSLKPSSPGWAAGWQRCFCPMQLGECRLSLSGLGPQGL